ncbi:MAG: HlyD family efflux transporter periplasmic adaptor subunit [Lentimicrobium sp.]|nr:HlyD family efflux transporter periplasmic adaptor subunit [Lentimicrobium sp.]
MKARIQILILFILATGIVSCKKNKPADAYGNFEAILTTVSAQSAGQILWFKAEEGSILKKGDTIGVIDTAHLYLKKLQLIAQRSAAASKSGNLSAQASVFEQQKRNLEKDRKRIENLLEEQAATPKQMDDVIGAMAVIDRQKSAVQSQQVSLTDELKAIDAQIAQVVQSISKCYIINPIEGTVLSRLAEPGEVTVFGKPLYKISDLSVMELRVFISGNMLSSIKTGQKADIFIDGQDEMFKFSGKVTWISPTAEFTPKIIQTRDERVNLVYAVKLKVPNDGSLKIAMPAEVLFEN